MGSIENDAANNDFLMVQEHHPVSVFINYRCSRMLRRKLKLHFLTDHDSGYGFVSNLTYSSSRAVSVDII